MHQIGDFKGNPTLTIKQRQDDRFGLTFGLSKAKLILDHLDVIRRFYEENKHRVPENAMAK